MIALLERCGKYQFFIPKEKAEYGRRVAKYSITPTIRYFAKVDKQERTLLQAKENYLKELAKRKHDKVTEVEVLPPKKHGCLLLIGVQLDDRVKLYVKEMQKKGVIINTRVIMAAAEGIVTHHDANLIADGGPLLACFLNFLMARFLLCTTSTIVLSSILVYSLALPLVTLQTVENNRLHVCRWSTLKLAT